MPSTCLVSVEDTDRGTLRITRRRGLLTRKPLENKKRGTVCGGLPAHFIHSWQSHRWKTPSTSTVLTPNGRNRAHPPPRHSSRSIFIDPFTTQPCARITKSTFSAGRNDDGANILPRLCRSWNCEARKQPPQTFPVGRRGVRRGAIQGEGSRTGVAAPRQGRNGAVKNDRALLFDSFRLRSLSLIRPRSGTQIRIRELPVPASSLVLNSKRFSSRPSSKCPSVSVGS